MREKNTHSVHDVVKRVEGMTIVLVNIGELVQRCRRQRIAVVVVDERLRRLGRARAATVVALRPASPLVRALVDVPRRRRAGARRGGRPLRCGDDGSQLGLCMRRPRARVVQRLRRLDTKQLVSKGEHNDT